MVSENEILFCVNCDCETFIETPSDVVDHIIISRDVLCEKCGTYVNFEHCGVYQNFKSEKYLELEIQRERIKKLKKIL